MDTNTATPRIAEGRTLAGLFSDLWRETTSLVRDETRLARIEMSEKVSQIESAATSMAIGGAVLFAGFLVLLFAASAGLERVLPPEQAAWLAPLIVGGVVALVGAALLASARSHLKGTNLKPTRTLNSLERDRDLAREHLK